jgi:hypothetical protein
MLDASPVLCMSKRDLHRATNAHRKGIDIFNRALRNLTAEDVIAERTKGRTSFYWASEAEDVVENVIRSSDDTSESDKPAYIN